MTRFEIVKRILDTLWDTVECDNEDEKIRLIKEEDRSLFRKYRNLAKVKNIDYSKPETQFAYLYKYTPAHSDILYQVIKKISRKKKFKESGKFCLTSFGGGPGSDLLGFMKFFENEQVAGIELIHNSCDKDDDWSFCWSSVLDQVSPDSTFSKITASFHKVDVTDYAKRKRIDQFLASDAFTFLYFISEILSKKDEASGFLQYIFDNIASGSVIIFIDNEMDEVIKYFKSFLLDGYDIIIDEYEDMRLSLDEEKSVLDEYRGKLETFPKLTAKVHICVGIKK